MTLAIQIPDAIERELRAAMQDFDAQAKEAMFVELYRQGQLTRFQLSNALGIGRFEADGILKKHRVTEDLLTLEEFEEELRQAAPLVRK